MPGHITVVKGTIVKLQRPETKAKKNFENIKFVKEIIREAVGFGPYERHIIELLRLGQDRQAVRFATARIGKFRQAVRKVNEMGEFKN